MTLSTCSPDVPVDDPMSPTDSVRENKLQRSAFYLESQGSALFAWLHRRGEAELSQHGLLICPPVGVEQLHSHRALRHLADAVALHGLPVVRFDYHGTGDSPGTDEDPHRLTTWIANVRDAIRWMRNDLGCRHVSVIGLRLGGTLATLAADDQEVDNLLLWAPVVKGSRYFRELKAISLMVEGRAPLQEDPTGAVKAAGFVMTKATADDVAKIELLTAQPRARRALLILRDDATNDTRLRDHFRTQGIQTDQIEQPGYVGMMAEPHATVVPETAIANISRWLADRAKDDSATETALVQRSKQFQDADSAHGTSQITFASTPHSELPYRKPSEPNALASGQTLQKIDETSPPLPPAAHQLREQLYQISGNPHLFGIHCEPADDVDERLPLVMLLSSGTTHRIGPGRLYVQLARQLGRQGFRTLRMDFCGVGDSVLPNAAAENNPYAETVFRDVDLALRFAKAEWGTQRVVLMGLCSGAYAAFQSAVQLPHPELIESVLINPLTYFWKDGMSLDHTQNGRENALHYYLHALVDPQKWVRLLSGKSQLGIWGGLKRFGQRMLWAREKIASDKCAAHGCQSIEYGHPARDHLPTDLDRVMRTGRQLALFCSTSDPGHFQLMYRARRKATQMERAGRLNCFFVEDANHTFSNPASRQVLIDSVGNYLAGRFQR